MIYAIKTTKEENWLRVWEIIVKNRIKGIFPYLDSSGYYTEITEKWSRVEIVGEEFLQQYLIEESASQEIASTELQNIEKEMELLILEEDSFTNYSSIVSFAYQVDKIHWFKDKEALVDHIALNSSNNKTFVILSSYLGMENLDFFENYSLILNDTGIITATDVEQLSWIILKGALSNFYITEDTLQEKKNVITLPQSKKKFNNILNNSTIYNNESTLLDSFNKITNEGLINSFYISTHGTEDCILLSDSIVCGQSKRFRGEGMDCKINKNCPIHKKGILAADIPANFVINSTCFGYRPFNSILPSSVTLSNAFLDNYASVYISSVGIKHGPDAEICFLHNLLLHGNTAGEAVSLLNNWLFQSNVDFPCYLVIGNPKQKYKGLEETEMVKITIKEDTDSSSKIILNDIRGKSLIKIKLNEALNSYNFVENTSRSEFFYSILIENNVRYLYLYSWSKFERERIEIILHESLPHLDYVPGHELSSIEKQIVGNKFENETLQLNNLLVESSKLVKEVKYNPEVFYKIKRNYQKVNEIFSILNQNIINKLMDKASSSASIFLPEMYVNQVQMINNSKKKSRCFICDNKANEYAFQHLTTKEQRYLLYCPKCGCISDRPEDNKLTIEIYGDTNIPNEGIFSQLINLKNTSNKKIKGFAFLTHLGLDEWSSSNKKSISFVLEPGESVHEEVQFTIKKKIQPSIYYFKSMAIVDSQLYYSNKPIYIFKKF
ncbi:hypothetical protein [Paenisporosarcina sp.]|uniref:hypothetical protein n=1 Tax=Paenisporosarcina sp. TaxID=1932001 RepID=UPI003C75C949